VFHLVISSTEIALLNKALLLVKIMKDQITAGKHGASQISEPLSYTCNQSRYI